MPKKKSSQQPTEAEQPQESTAQKQTKGKKRKQADEQPGEQQDAGMPSTEGPSAAKAEEERERKAERKGEKAAKRARKEEKAAGKAGQKEENGEPATGNGSQPAQPPSFSPQAWCDEHSVRIEIPRGGQPVVPFLSFDQAAFPSNIMNMVNKAGFTAPTPIQAAAWPVVLGGRDIVAVSKTGSGKTLGFLGPGMVHIKNNGPKDPRQGPQVLVLAPTRELAVQIKEEADRFGRTAGIRTTCLSGGVPKGPQLRDLNMGVHIAIATPGRLNDFLEAGQVRLGQVSFLVLDEADRMLDMGFEPQIKTIAAALPKQRQTLFFSATWPMAVRKIASQFVGPQTVHIFVGDGAGVDGKLVANKSITQYVKFMGGRNDKLAELQRILRSKPSGTRFMIFCKTKSMCDQLASSLPHEFRSAALHGDKMQRERDYVLAAFKRGNTPILVATDVAARGLDIPSVAAVVNFDFPQGIEDYIHRIGRTGRAGAQGESHTFMTPDDAKHARKLSQVWGLVDPANGIGT